MDAFNVQIILDIGVMIAAPQVSAALAACCCALADTLKRLERAESGVISEPVPCILPAEPRGILVAS